MVDSARSDGRGIARLLAVCVVLFGVFLMHGAPATAAEGCHGAMPAMEAPATAGDHDAVAMHHDASAAQGSGPAARAAETSGMPGTLCVSSPAQERPSLPAPGLLAVAGVAALALLAPALLRAAANGTGRRGPPAGGRDLLLQVCTART